MSTDRLPAHLEVAAVLRRAEASGGFASVLRKGDADRGSILLVVTERGRHFACLERMPSLSGGQQWQRCGPSESAGSTQIAEFLARRARLDEDSWVLELDIAEPERFIAETTSKG
jgi:hypothetical protein